ncbi:hypothetical protein [Nocardia australiensis]|uniref:hypothetical protein n=1 Tax=Nocardia australiensis TaxID=2887191 RepID=UPI001D133BE5|nr:hypothetical protein [Nocardia australiensis]
MRLGTALWTPIPAASESTGAAAVYAVFPPADFREGRDSTTYLLVESVEHVDTCVYPCDRDGVVITLELLAHTPYQSHRKALLLAGYEMEIAHVHA